MSNWIPVEERLPERGYWLVTTTGNEVMEAFYGGKLWRNDMDDNGAVHVIAWQPLPEPYQKPRRFVVGRHTYEPDGYLIRDTKLADRTAADMIPTREAAEAIAKIYEESYT